jgi:hypothetical protein
VCNKTLANLLCSGDVKRCPAETQEGASNVGCHLRPWPSAPVPIKRLFHHYTSKDDGRLFHMKLLMGFGNDTTAKPKFIYIGSHNFSQGAYVLRLFPSKTHPNHRRYLSWGQISTNAKGEERMTDISNIECGKLYFRNLNRVRLRRFNRRGDSRRLDRQTAGARQRMARRSCPIRPACRSLH